MKHKNLLIYTWFIRTILYFLPDIPIFMRFRGFMYGIGMQRCGKDFQVTHDAIIKDLSNISVGNNCFVGNHSVIMGSGKTIIGNEVMFAPHVVIISGNHTSINGSFRYGMGEIGEIIIGNGSWIAANSTIQRGATLPSNSILSANSFLNKKFDIPNSIYGGVPAQLLKNNINA